MPGVRSSPLEGIYPLDKSKGASENIFTALRVEEYSNVCESFEITM